MQSFINTVYNITDKSLFMYIAKLLQILCLLNKAIIQDNASNKEARYISQPKIFNELFSMLEYHIDLLAYPERNQITVFFSTWPRTTSGKFTKYPGR